MVGLLELEEVDVLVDWVGVGSGLVELEDWVGLGVDDDEPGYQSGTSSLLDVELSAVELLDVVELKVDVLEVDEAELLEVVLDSTEVELLEVVVVELELDELELDELVELELDELEELELVELLEVVVLELETVEESEFSCFAQPAKSAEIAKIPDKIAVFFIKYLLWIYIFIISHFRPFVNILLENSPLEPTRGGIDLL